LEKIKKIRDSRRKASAAPPPAPAPETGGETAAVTA